MPDSQNRIPLLFHQLTENEMQERSAAHFERMRTRRSVRDFSDEPFPVEVIYNAIRTAGSAPSGANKQPWHFSVIQDQALKEQIRVAVEGEEKENYTRRFSEELKADLETFETDFSKPHLTGAPYIIVVFKENYRVVNGKRKKNYYVNESVGIASGMLIASLHLAGLATLTHTPNPMKFLNDMLSRPVNETPVMVLPVGYPAKDATVPDLKRKPLSDIMTTF